jgi:hypothetical protein
MYITWISEFGECFFLVALEAPLRIFFWGGVFFWQLYLTQDICTVSAIVKVGLLDAAKSVIEGQFCGGTRRCGMGFVIYS